jgi:hypothetical protein
MSFVEVQSYIPNRSKFVLEPIKENTSQVI